MSSRDLFSWAAEQPDEQAVINFLERREHLPRWKWWRENFRYRYLDRVIDREDGKLAPAPILAFPLRHPASPGSYSPDTAARTG